MYYIEKVRPRISDIDRFGRLSYTALLHLMENTGSHQADLVNDSILDGSISGIAWVLTEWRVHIDKLPSDLGELEIKTWGRGKAPSSIVFRGFTISKNGEIVVRADSKFALVDLKSGRLTKITPEALEAYKPETEMPFDCELPRLREPKIYESEISLKLRKSDIDFNNHMHNAQYLGLALEAVEDEICQNGIFHDIRIVYRKPLTSECNAIIKCHKEDCKYTVGIYDGENLCSIVELDSFSQP